MEKFVIVKMLRYRLIDLEKRREIDDRILKEYGKRDVIIEREVRSEIERAYEKEVRKLVRELVGKEDREVERIVKRIIEGIVSGDLKW